MTGGPELFWIDEPFGGRIAVSRRPQGFDELHHDIAGWRASRLDAVVSMLEADEADDLGLTEQARHCRDHGIEFISCPVPDHGIPEDADAFLLRVDRALAHLLAGRRVAAHCFAGIGRSPLFVASVLVRHGVDAETTWQRLMAARGIPLPDTRAQRQWVIDLARRIGQQPAGKR